MRKRKKKALQSRRAFFHPGTELLAEDLGGALWWQLAKPQDLTATHGVNLTLEYLTGMVEDFDPNRIERASINRDHKEGGPSLGWIQELEIRGGAMWGRVGSLDKKLRKDIRAGRYLQGSIEWFHKHAITARQALKGFAVLGNKSPAIKGLLPLTAAEPQDQPTGGTSIMSFDLTKISATAADGVAKVQGSPGASPPGISITVTDSAGTSLTATASEDGSFEASGSLASGSLSVCPADGSFECSSIELAATPAEPASAASKVVAKAAAALPQAAGPPEVLRAMERRLAAVELQNQQLHAAEAADGVLNGLLDRVTPGMIRAGAREALILAHDQPRLLAIIKNVLAAARPHGLSAEQLAAANGGELKAAGGNALLARAEELGIRSDQAEALLKKYPSLGGPN